MSKSKGKMNSTPSGKKRRNVGAERKARKNVAKNSVIIFWVTAIVLVLLFVGRWVVAIANGYFGSFVQVDASAAQAVDNMRGLYPGEDERDELLPWDRVDMGVTKAHLWREWEQCLAGKLSPDCRAGCVNCGARALTGGVCDG